MADETTYKLRSDVRYRVVGGEAVVLRQDDAEVVVLNEVGTRMLDLMASGRPVEEARRALLDEFQVERDELDRDLSEFLARLVSDKVLEPLKSG